MQKELQLKRDYAAVGEEVGRELGGRFISTYQEKYPNDTVSYQIGRTIIEQILAQPGCVGMRFYNALNEEGQKTLVYVGVDASGADIVTRVMIEDDGSMVSQPAIVADRTQGSSILDDIITWIKGI